MGSCCNRLTDAGLVYLGENEPGIQSGLELKHLYLVCATRLQGRGWLDVASVKESMPKLEAFHLAAGRASRVLNTRGSRFFNDFEKYKI